MLVRDASTARGIVAVIAGEHALARPLDRRRSDAASTNNRVSFEAGVNVTW
jgi:hypothetical protein